MKTNQKIAEYASQILMLTRKNNDFSIGTIQVTPSLPIAQLEELLLVNSAIPKKDYVSTLALKFKITTEELSSIVKQIETIGTEIFQGIYQLDNKEKNSSDGPKQAFIDIELPDYINQQKLPINNEIIKKVQKLVNLQEKKLTVQSQKEDDKKVQELQIQTFDHDQEPNEKHKEKKDRKDKDKEEKKKKDKGEKDKSSKDKKKHEH